MEPMIEIVRADGPLRGTFDEVEGLLRQTRERALFNDHPALERNLRHLRLVRQHALPAKLFHEFLATARLRQGT